MPGDGHGVGLEVNIIIVSRVSVGTSYQPLPGLDPEKLLVWGIETHMLESGCTSRKRRESIRGIDPLLIWGVKEYSPWICFLKKSMSRRTNIKPY